MLSDRTGDNFCFLQLRGAKTDTNPDDLILNGETVLAKELIADH